MKYGIFLAILLLWPCRGKVGAQAAAVGLYNEANQLYRQGAFGEAQEKYLQSIAGGLVDVRCYYNLANASFKAGLLGEAILWYERALRLDPRDEAALANLRFANAVKKDRDPPAEGNAVWHFLVDLYRYPTPNELCLAFSFLLATVFAIATWRLWRQTPSFAVWLSALLFCAVATVATGVFLAARIHQQEERNMAIVTAAEETARSEPDADKTALFVIREGTKVQIERREGTWVLVRLGNGFGGWLPAAALTQI